MPTTPRFSVITAAYNAAAFVREAVDSALAQTLPPHELIVVDDGSTDGTLEILEAIADPRLHILRAAHRGVSHARNLGLDHATGDLVTFLDADDRWLPGKLAVEAGIFLGEPEVGALILNFQRFDERGVFPSPQFEFCPELARLSARPAAGGAGFVIQGDAFSQLVSFGAIPGWAGATSFRASALDGLRFDDRLPPTEDLHFCLRAFLRTTVAYQVEPLLQVRRHGGNATADLEAMLGYITRSLVALDTEPLTRPQRQALDRRVAMQHISLAVRAAREGSAGQALGQFAAAARRGGRTLSLAKQALLTPAYLAEAWGRRLTGRTGRVPD